MQSQFSNDLLLSRRNNPATYGLWLDRKGRVRADSHVLQHGSEEFFIFSEYTPADRLIALLEENIIADEVEIEDVTEDASCLRLFVSAPDTLPNADLFQPGSFLIQENLILWHDPAPALQTTLLALSWNASHQVSVANLFPEGSNLTSLSLDEVNLRRILAQCPAVPYDIGPSDLPQEGGLDTYAVSFNKGCYLGQEVMARLKAMGTPRRTLRCVEFDSLPPQLPCDIFAGDREVGELRSAITASDGTTRGLALLKTAALGQPLALATPDGPKITIRSAHAASHESPQAG